MSIVMRSYRKKDSVSCANCGKHINLNEMYVTKPNWKAINKKCVPCGIMLNIIDEKDVLKAKKRHLNPNGDFIYFGSATYEALAILNKYGSLGRNEMIKRFDKDRLLATVVNGINTAYNRGYTESEDKTRRRNRRFRLTKRGRQVLKYGVKGQQSRLVI